MRVGLVTTGKTEIVGLPRAIEALFPGHSFIAIEDIPGRPFHGVTSARLPIQGDAGLPTGLDRIVAEAVAAIDPARADAMDLVVVLDDLELANRDQPGVVIDTIRAAFLSHVEGYRGDEGRYSTLRRAVPPSSRGRGRSPTSPALGRRVSSRSCGTCDRSAHSAPLAGVGESGEDFLFRAEVIAWP